MTPDEEFETLSTGEKIVSVLNDLHASLESIDYQLERLAACVEYDHEGNAAFRLKRI